MMGKYDGTLIDALCLAWCASGGIFAAFIIKKDVGQALNMALFLSHYENKVDAKGRVSIPVAFRDVLKTEFSGGNAAIQIIFSPARHYEAVDGYAPSFMQELQERIEHSLDFDSEDHDYFANAVFANAVALSLDGDGRVILPQALRDAAQVKDKAVFVGLGRKFQICSPENFKILRDKSRMHVRENGLTLSPKREGGA